MISVLMIEIYYESKSYHNYTQNMSNYPHYSELPTAQQTHSHYESDDHTPNSSHLCFPKTHNPQIFQNYQSNLHHPTSIPADSRTLDISDLLSYQDLKLPEIPSESIVTWRPPNQESASGSADGAEDVQLVRRGCGKNYKKNLMKYMSLKVIDIMFGFDSGYLQKKCRYIGLDYEQFRIKYEEMHADINGPQSLNKLFEVDQSKRGEKQSKDLFLRVFKRILRKHYIIYSLRQGKMRNLMSYIREKNLHLLHFADNLRELLSQLAKH